MGVYCRALYRAQGTIHLGVNQIPWCTARFPQFPHFSSFLTFTFHFFCPWPCPSWSCRTTRRVSTLTLYRGVRLNHVTWESYLTPKAIINISYLGLCSYQVNSQNWSARLPYFPNSSLILPSQPVSVPSSALCITKAQDRWNQRGHLPAAVLMGLPRRQQDPGQAPSLWKTLHSQEHSLIHISMKQHFHLWLQ